MQERRKAESLKLTILGRRFDSIKVVCHELFSVRDQMEYPINIVASIDMCSKKKNIVLRDFSVSLKSKLKNLF